MNFDVWNENKKSGHLDHPLPSYGEIHFNIFVYISAKAGFLWFPTRYIKNKNCFLKDLHRTTCGHRLEWLGLSVLFHMLFLMVQFESEIDSELKMFSRKILIDSNQQTL